MELKITYAYSRWKEWYIGEVIFVVDINSATVDIKNMIKKKEMVNDVVILSFN